VRLLTDTVLISHEQRPELCPAVSDPLSRLCSSGSHSQSTRVAGTSLGGLILIATILGLS
jgi:hypothetical protein